MVFCSTVVWERAYLIELRNHIKVPRLLGPVVVRFTDLNAEYDWQVFNRALLREIVVYFKCRETIMSSLMRNKSRRKVLLLR